MGLLRRLFGPSTDDLWRQLCDDIGAEFIKGGFWKGSSRVLIHVKNWTITLDTYRVRRGNHSVTFTRMRAPYVNRDNFRFAIYRKGLLSEVGKLFGMQDIEVGNPKMENLQPLFGVPSYLNTQDVEIGETEFDREFIVQSNDDAKIQALLANARIRRLIQDQPALDFKVKDDEGWFGPRFPDNVDELYFCERGVIKDPRRLQALRDLFVETLIELGRIGSAAEDDPTLVL
jgi:hypothetical protein